MTVLRSRKILSTPKQKPPTNVVAQPPTPPKTSEFLNPSPEGVRTPMEDIVDPLIGVGVEAGSVMVSQSGTVRRVSARLAKKLVEVGSGSGKRRKLQGTSSPSVVLEVSQDLGGGGSMELFQNGEKIEDSVTAARLGFDCDITLSVRETQDSGGQCKRKLNLEMNALGSESSEKGKGFLSLRSGKKVPQREINVNDIRIAGGSLQGMERGAVWSGEGRGSREILVTDDSTLLNPGLNDRISSLIGRSDHDASKLLESSGSEVVAKGKSSIVSKTDTTTGGRLSKEKGKMKMEADSPLFSGKTKFDSGGSSSSGSKTVELKVENMNGSSGSGVELSASDVVIPDQVQVGGTNLSENGTRSVHRERFRNFARRNASRFAHFSSHDEIGAHADGVARTRTDVTPPETSNKIEDWPGPFSTAMKIIKDRESNRNGARHGGSTDKSEAVELKWFPRNHQSGKHQKQVPSLQDICLSILSNNADAITSLDFVPDALRHKICWFLCDNRSMDSHFLQLLVHGTPTEIRIRDCSWLSEEQFVKIFEGCNTSKLAVLQFDQGGSCMPDYILSSALARSSNCLPALTAISLKGAYRLSDVGLSMLASAAPCLKSVDISQCPLLTSEGICSLASSLKSVLRELYIDNSHGIDAMLILPALKRLENLEVLSVAGVLTVCDDFVREFVSAHGSRMKELVLADCIELTDSSLEVIVATCSNLRAIDLTNLRKLTDISIGHLANGCQAIQMLKLCRNAFSDEAIAAYFEVNGVSLKCLSLNNVIQVSTHTALSLARNCKNLRSLDLSWCRNLTNEALGLIVDSCLSLEVLKLFGCTQVTDVFVDGHSNPQVKLIGLKMSPLFKHIEFPDFLLGPLRYPSASP